METKLIEDLDDEQRADIVEASAARIEAHAPHSHFMVGALIRANDGQVVTGWNVENVAYGSTTCAEVGAVSSLRSATRDSGLKRVVVIGGEVGKDGVITSPCGNCRQVLAEIAGIGDSNPEIIMGGVKLDVVRVSQLSELLPESFDF